MRSILAIYLLTLHSNCYAFHAQLPDQGCASFSTSTTALHGILGRFRKKQEVKQVKTVSAGQSLPDGDVEKLTMKEDGGIASEPSSILEVLGSSKAILVGMPGAFTPTCSTQHLPGYVRSAETLAKLGIETIAVITTNDRFVNGEWGSQQGVFSEKSKDKIVVLSDGDGDFVKSVGLAEDMGFGVGVRSKRFAMVVENGKIVHLLSNEGMDDCSATSAEAVVNLLSPAEDRNNSPIEIDSSVIGGVAVGIAAIAMLATGGIGNPSKDMPAPSGRAGTPKSTPVQPKFQPKSENTFSLLNEYITR